MIGRTVIECGLLEVTERQPRGAVVLEFRVPREGEQLDSREVGQLRDALTEWLAVNGWERSA